MIVAKVAVSSRDPETSIVACLAVVPPILPADVEYARGEGLECVLSHDAYSDPRRPTSPAGATGSKGPFRSGGVMAETLTFESGSI